MNPNDTFDQLAAEVFVALTNHSPKNSHYPDGFASLDKSFVKAWNDLKRPTTEDQKEIFRIILGLKEGLLRQSGVIAASKRIKAGSRPEKEAESPITTKKEQRKKRLTSIVLQKGANNRTESLLIGHDDGSADVVEIVRVGS